MRRKPDPSIFMVGVVMNRVIASHEDVSKKPVVLTIAIQESKDTLRIVFLVGWELEKVVINRHLELPSIDGHVDILIIFSFVASHDHKATGAIIVVIEARNHPHHELVS